MIPLYWLFCQIDDFKDIFDAVLSIAITHACNLSSLMGLLAFWNVQIKLSYLIMYPKCSKLSTKLLKLELKSYTFRFDLKDRPDKLCLKLTK